MSNRRAGRGHIYRRGSTWWISYYLDGRRVRESSRSRRRPVAAQLLAARLARLKPRPGLADARLHELLDSLIGDYMLNDRPSLRRLRCAVAHLREHLGDAAVSSITASEATEYAAARVGAGAGRGTVNLELGVLRRAFRLAHELGRIAEVPRIRMLKAPSPRSGFVERPELERILMHLPAHVRPAVLVAALTGWRVKSELLTRRWRHVDLEAGWLRLEPGETKNGEGRQFPLRGELRAVLASQAAKALAIEQRTGHRPVALFFDDRGRVLRSIRAAWRQAVTAAGLKDLRPHDLRRTCVRNLERAGISRSVGMALVGHRSQSIYHRYAIVDEHVLSEAAEKLDTHNRAQSVHSETEGAAVPTSPQHNKDKENKA